MITDLRLRSEYKGMADKDENITSTPFILDMFAFTPLSLATLISSSSASAVVRRNELGLIQARQAIPGLLSSFLDDIPIPSQCTNLCAVLNSTCASESCICSATIASGIIDCADCVFDVLGSSAQPGQQDTVQTIYNGYAGGCQDMGLPVPALNITLGPIPVDSTPSGSTGTTGNTSSTGATSAKPNGATGLHGDVRAYIPSLVLAALASVFL